MTSELDKSHTWFLEKIEYEKFLTVQLSEGLKGGIEEIVIGDESLGSGNKIEIKPASKKAIIEFREILSWQCIDESATTYDKSEISDGGKFIVTLTKADYLDFIKNNHQWYIDINSAVKQYRILTENEIIEVIAYSEPKVEVKNA